jgi:hypothetical protein
MDPKDEQVDGQRKDDKPGGTREEMFGDVCLQRRKAYPRDEHLCVMRIEFHPRLGEGEGIHTIVFPRLISIICHKSHTTAAPTVINVNKPTILHPRVQARKNPVANSQAYHSAVNSLRVVHARRKGGRKVMNMMVVAGGFWIWQGLTGIAVGGT